MALRVKKRQRMLLLYSEIIKQFPWFREILEGNEIISEEFVLALDSEKQNFFDNMFPRIVKQVVDEWRGNPNSVRYIETDDKNQWISCALCGHKIRWIFRIQNRLNGNELEVGSECVKYFGINFGGKSIRDLIRETKRAGRLNALNEKIPGIARIVEGWASRLNNYPIVIPLHYEQKYSKLGQAISGLYGGYLDEKYGDVDEVTRGILSLLDKADQLLKEIQEYVDANIGVKFVAKSELARWLKSTGQYETLERIKKDNGRITWGTACKITEPNFMKLIASEFTPILANIGLRVIGVDSDRNGYVLGLSRNSKIRLFCKYSDFVFEYGGIIFGETVNYPLDLEHIAKISLLDYNEISVGQLLEELAGKIEGLGVSVWGYAFEFNELVFVERDKGTYIVVNLKECLNKVKGLLLDLTHAAVGDLISYINNFGKRYSRKELRELEEIRRQKYLTLG